MAKVTHILIKEPDSKVRREFREHLFLPGRISMLADEAVTTIGETPQAGLCMKRFKGDLQTSGLDYGKLVAGDILMIGALKVKVSQVGKVCHSEDCLAYKEHKTCFMVTSTLFGEIEHPGKVVVGDVCTCLT